MRTLAVLFAATLCLAHSTAAEFSPEFEIEASKVDRTGQPVRVPIVLPASFVAKEATVTIDGKQHPAQVTKPSLVSKAEKPATGGENHELVFIAPQLKAGAALKGKATISDTASSK